MSSSYRQLVSCERQLRKCFITKTVYTHPTTVTSQFRLRSYRILSHAEIEYFVESIILNKIEREKKKWLKTHSTSNCISNILAYIRIEFPNISPHLTEITSGNDFQFRVNKVLNNYQNIIKYNNGIKEENIIPILIPLGIDYQKINQTLLNNMSSFGVERGSTAHNSSKVQNLINPNDEINMVNQIITDLLDIDKLVLRT